MFSIQKNIIFFPAGNRLKPLQTSNVFRTFEGQSEKQIEMCVHPVYKQFVWQFQHIHYLILFTRFTFTVAQNVSGISLFRFSSIRFEATNDNEIISIKHLKKRQNKYKENHGIKKTHSFKFKWFQK